MSSSLGVVLVSDIDGANEGLVSLRLGAGLGTLFTYSQESALIIVEGIIDSNTKSFMVNIIEVLERPSL